MGKKVKEYKSGDFIFAKVKGYPAWPARVQRMNGKKYFVYFYGTGEIANLPPNMIFDYAENKDKFLTKTVKRRDFNDGVKQIEYDFANNVPLEDVIGIAPEVPPEANDTANDTVATDADDSAIADTTADETMADETLNETPAAGGVEDSDDAGPLVIDEGKQQAKGKKGKVDPKPPAKETPKAKEPKTPRGRPKRQIDEDGKDKEDEEKKEEEIVSRSGRKIRPKRYMDEQTEENTTLPSPAPKKKRTASPSAEKEKETETKDKSGEKKQFNAVSQSELEGLKEPFKPADPEKDNILIACLPSGQYVGVRLFLSRPTSFKNDASRLQWDRQAASNAITLKLQLERGQITPQSISAQLVMDLNLTDEEKAALDKEKETDEKKSRVQFLKTEMKLIELDAKIKTCLCLEKADTETCLKLMDELLELDIKPLMLLKHPTCLETVKRMRAYVGNAPSWDLSDAAAAAFGKQAHRIRKQADAAYCSVKNLFTTPDGLSFWEYFSERVQFFKKVTAHLHADELLELVHAPLEMTMPSCHTMKSAVDAANTTAEDNDTSLKKKGTPAKAKKAEKPVNSTPAKLTKRQARKQEDKEKEKAKEAEEQAEKEPATNENHVENDTEKPAENDKQTDNDKQIDKDTPADIEAQDEVPKENDVEPEKNKNKKEKKDKSKEKDDTSKEEKSKSKDDKISKEDKSKAKEGSSKDDKSKEDKSIKDKDSAKESEPKTVEENNVENSADIAEVTEKADKSDKVNDVADKSKEDTAKEAEKMDVDEPESVKSEKKENGSESEKKDNGKGKTEKEDKAGKEKDEPRAKRSRESKKTEPPPRSPAKRKSKF